MLAKKSIQFPAQVNAYSSNTMTQDVTIIMQEVYVKEIQASTYSLQNSGNHTSATVILKIRSAEHLSSVHFFKQVSIQVLLSSSAFIV
jgi:hypothetical protein